MLHKAAVLAVTQNMVPCLAVLPTNNIMLHVKMRK